MKKINSVALLAVVVLVLGVLFDGIFIVHQAEQALVLRYGRPVRVESTPGLKYKVPFVDSLERFERRVLVFNSDSMDVLLRDQDRLIVDAFVTYKIIDPLRFFQAVRNERIMNMRLESVLETSVREVMGKEDLSTLLSPRRSQIMHEIRAKVKRLSVGEKQEAAQGNTQETALLADKTAPVSSDGFGIEIIDVRIMRTDLPKETSDPIYNRMRSDRQKVAERFRAEGKKESQIITSEAEKQRTILLAEAQKKSEIIRGEGDLTASKIFAASFGQDPEFYSFYRSMQAYRNSIKKGDTTMVLSPDSGFLKYMERGSKE